MADSFLARELLTETSDEMRRHLETCPACRADLAAPRALCETLRRAFQNAGELSPTPEFTTRLRTTLKRAARQEPARAYRIFENVPPNDVMTTGGPARVLERHACVYKGRRFAHIVFDYRGERVSLVVTTVDRSDRRTLPEAALPRVTSAGRIDDMPVVFFRTSGQIVFFAGHVAQADLVALADAVAGPLYRELAGT